MASLSIDGVVEQTKNVTLDGGNEQLMSFPVLIESAGSYAIAIDGKQTVIEAKEFPRPPTGTMILEEMKRTGTNRLKLENQTGLDVVAVLCSADSVDVPLLAVYIQSDDTHMISKIKRGTYILYWTAGKYWDDESGEFIGGAFYRWHPEELEMMSSASKYWRFWGTLHLWEGWLPIEEYKFPKLR